MLVTLPYNMLSYKNIANKSELPEIMRQFEVWEAAVDYLLRVILSAQLAVCIRPFRTTICSETGDSRICAAAAFHVVLLYLREYGAW